MLQKSNRLTKEDFKGIRPKVFFRGILLDIAYTVGSSCSSNKFACVTAKKTLKRAVDRNSVKRRVLHTLLHKNFSFSKNYFFIIYPKKTILSVTYSQIEDEIQKAFDTLQ